MKATGMVEKVSGILKGTNLLVVLAIAGFAVCTFAPGVSAETVEEGPLKRNDWTISVVPYLWATALDGEIGVGNVEAEVDVPFSDLLSELNGVLMLDFVVHKGRFGLFVNPFYAKLGSERTQTLLEGTILQRDIKLGATLKMFIMSFGVGYRLGPYPLGNQEDGHKPAVIVEPYVGGRLTEIDVELELVDLDRRFQDDIRWADPMIGVMSVWNLYPRWNVTLGGNVGGFGVGTDLAWTVTGLGGYRFHFSKRIMGNVLFGYRALHQDFEPDSVSQFKYDTTMHGPYVGVSIDFGQWPLIK
jgi:hypothetical protein